MAARGSGHRDWALWFQPRALEGRPEGAVFAGLCIFSLALIGGADLVTGPRATLGSFQVVPVIAAGWLLSDRLLMLVSAVAILVRCVTVAVGVNEVVTVAVQAGVVPFMAVVSRTAAVSVAAAREAAARESLMARVARIASLSESPDEILRRVAEQMARDGVRGGSISLIDERNRLQIVAAEGELDGEVNDSRQEVANTGRPLIVNDLDGQTRSLVAVPLLAAGRVLGVLEVHSRRPDQFGETDVLLLEQVAVAVAAAAQRAGALKLADETLQRRLRELAILLDAARGLAASLDLDVLITAICHSVSEMPLRAVQGPPRSTLIQLNGSECTVLGDYDESGQAQPGRTFALRDDPALVRAAATGAAATAQLAGGESAACAPIRVGSQLWGALSLVTQEEHGFDASELRLLEGMADLAGLAIGNAEALRLEKLRAEQLREHADRMAGLEHAKSEFLRLASHELRGPLAVLRGYLSMLADGTFGDLPRRTGSVLKVMSAKVEEINLLIDQMLETARLEDSRLQLALAFTDLRDLVRTAGAAMKLLAGPRHPLRVSVPSRPVPVMIDGPRVMTILTNLIDNAVKYSPNGGEVRVRLSTAGAMARIDVSDKGLGIDPADFPRLFARFGRLVTGENSHIAGTGLGLYLARELARMHGGEIRVRSALGQGSTFALELPMVEAQTGASASASA